MHIDVRIRGVHAPEVVREHALSRARTELGRFGRALSEVVVRLSDVNGPRGGADKRCQVTLRGPGVGALTIADLTGDAFSAIDAAIHRAAKAVRRGLGRARALRR